MFDYFCVHSVHVSPCLDFSCTIQVPGPGILNVNIYIYNTTISPVATNNSMVQLPCFRQWDWPSNFTLKGWKPWHSPWLVLQQGP